MKKELRKRCYGLGAGFSGFAARGGTLLFLMVCCCLTVNYSILSAHAGEIAAKAAVVIDAESGKILYAKNPNLKLPPASTTKLLTAMVALDRVQPESIVTISEHAANTPSVSPKLRPGDRLTIRDLLYLALMRSINGAAVALAEATAGSEDAFVKMMNEKASRLGAENTRFINASGLPGAGQSVTAYELAMIMKESLAYPIIREIINTKTRDIYTLDGRRLYIKNTDLLLWQDDDLLGGKTGYTRAARHCFVGAAEKERTILITALLGEAARSNLWPETSFLLTKGHEVLTEKSEPTIYMSNIPDEPVMLASYDPDSSPKIKKIAKKYRLHVTSKKTETVANANKTKSVKVAQKKTLKKKGTTAQAKREGKKMSGKSLTAHNQEDTRKS